MSGNDPADGAPAYPPPGAPSEPTPAPGWGAGSPSPQAPPPPGSPPPPGWAPPTGPLRAPGLPAPGSQPAPGTWGAAHKPGAVPLRPLSLGDIYDAAFKIIRFNPSATVGSSVLVASVSMLLPVLATAALALFTDLTLIDPATFDPASTEPGSVATTGEAVAAVAPALLLVLGSLLAGFGLIFVTGMVTHVTAAAAVGRRLTLGEAWACTQGRRWRLVGMSLLMGLMWAVLLLLYLGIVAAVVFAGAEVMTILVVALLIGLLFVPLWLFLWVRVYYLAVPPLMLESVGVFRAIGRGFRLTRHQFWRTFGIGLLTVILVGVAGNVLSVPLAFVAAGAAAAIPDPQTAVIVSIAAQALGTVLATAFTAPFSAAVTSLQYVDQRIRKEAYDMELLAQAGVTAR